MLIEPAPHPLPTPFLPFSFPEDDRIPGILGDVYWPEYAAGTSGSQLQLEAVAVSNASVLLTLILPSENV